MDKERFIDVLHELRIYITSLIIPFDKPFKSDRGQTEGNIA